MVKLSLEVIDYQVQDKFPGQLRSVVESIYEGLDKGTFKNNSDVIKSKHSKQIETLVMERLGLNIVMDPKLHMYFPAAIIPFSSDYMLKASSPNGVSDASGPGGFLSSIFGSNKGIVNHIRKIETERSKGLNKLNNKRGFVDTKRARVGGYLSEVKHYLIVNFVTLKNLGLNPAETVAVIVHELGHAFSGLETHYRFTTTNSAISSIMEDLNGNKPDKAYYKYKRYFGAEDLQKAAINENSEITDFYGPLASRYINCLDSNVLNNKYDETNFEYLADNFGSRFGLGQDLVTGLHHIHKRYDYSITSSRAFFFSMHLIDIAGIAILLSMSLPIGAIIIGLLFLFNGSGSADMTYDLAKDRYGRIRNSIVDNLKDPYLPKEYSENLISQFEHIDAIMEDSITIKLVMDIVADFVKPGSRDASYYIGIQQQAENALNNTLFVKSAKLRNI